MNPLDPTPVQAERSVLGAMLLSRAAVWDVYDTLSSPSDFDDWRYETICRTIFTLAQDNMPTDVIAVGDALRDAGEIERLGGAGLLHELTGEVPTAANAGYYADIVKKLALKRRISVAAAAVVDLTRNMDGDAYEIADRARKLIDEAAETERFEIRPVGDSLPGVVESLTMPPRFVPTPWENIDELINGFRPGALYTIGARPGSGKTIMGLMAACALADHGNVAFSSLEMDTADLTKRILSMKGSIHMNNLTRSILTPQEMQRIGNLRGQIAKMPLFIDDRSGVNVNQIRAFVRSVSRRGPLSGVVIDYVQLIPGSDSRKPRHEIVGEITRALKTLSRELDVPVIMLAQLNRGSEGSGSMGGRRLPNLSDLRESGSIEQDSDVVLLLQRRVDDDDEYTDELDVVIAKNRHGASGRKLLQFEGQFARVSTYPWV